MLPVKLENTMGFKTKKGFFNAAFFVGREQRV
jgi:hypothetical protein